MRIAIFCVLMGLCGVFGQISTVHADICEIDAVRAIIGEAEGEGYRGMLAVAHALRNRDTLKGVYGHRAVSEQFVRGSRAISGAVVQRAFRAWHESESGVDITNGGNHWHNVGREGETYWTKVYRKTAEIGNHVFYRGAV